MTLHEENRARLRDSGSAVLAAAVRAGEISIRDAVILTVLSFDAGYPTGVVAEQIAQAPGVSKAQHSMAIRKCLLDLWRARRQYPFARCRDLH